MWRTDASTIAATTWRQNQDRDRPLEYPSARSPTNESSCGPKRNSSAVASAGIFLMRVFLSVRESPSREP